MYCNKPEYFYKVELKRSFSTDSALARVFNDYSFRAACLTEEAVLKHFRGADQEEVEAGLKKLDWGEYYYHTEVYKREDGVESKYEYRVSLEELEW